MNKARLEYEMNLRGVTRSDLCKVLGISRSAFYRKCNGISEFTQGEIQKIVDCLNLETPVGIFFDSRVSYRPQSGGLDITLGFQPAIVLIQAFETFLAGALTLDVKSSRGHITENGFHINPATSSGTITCGSYTFAYFAFG